MPLVFKLHQTMADIANNMDAHAAAPANADPDNTKPNSATGQNTITADAAQAAYAAAGQNHKR